MTVGGLARLAGWAALLVALLFITFLGGTYPWLGSQVVRIATWGVVGAVVGAWLLLAIVRPRWRPRRATVLPVALVLAVSTASAAASPLARVALGSVATGCLLALLYLCLVRLSANPWLRPRLGQLMTGIWVLVVVGYLAQVADAWSRWYLVAGAAVAPPLRPPDAALTFGASPIVAAVVVLLGPIALRRIWLGHPRIATALGVAALAAILISASRAAYVGVAGAEVIALGFSIGRGGFGLRERLPRRLVMALAGLVVAALVVALGTQLAARLADVATISERIDIWRSAAALFVDHPLLGVGPGTWPILKYAANPPGAPNIVVPHAHSVLIQSAAELGIVGLGALAALTISVGRRLLAEIPSTPRGRGTVGSVTVADPVDAVPARADAAAGPVRDPELRASAAAALVGIVGLAGMSLVDDYLNLLTVVLPLILLVAWVLGGAEGWEAPETEPIAVADLAGTAPWPRRVRGALPAAALPAATLGALLVLGLAGLRVADAGLAAEGGTMAATAGDRDGALRGYRHATEVDPDEPVYWMELGAELAATGDLAGARAQYARLVAVDGYAMNVLSLAWLDRAVGDRATVLAEVRTALERGEGDPVVALNAGALAAWAGDAALATDAYGRALAALPELAAAQYWQDAAVPRPAAAAAAQARLAALGTPSAAITAQVLRAYLGDPAVAEAALGTLPGGPELDRALAIVLELQGRRPEAIDVLMTSLRAAPYDGSTAAALSALEARAGDAVAADRFTTWAELVGVGTAAQSSASGSVVVTAGAAGTSDQPNNYPWILYLRFTGPVLTPPDYLVVQAR